MKARLLATCTASGLVALAGCNAIFGLDPACGWQTSNVDGCALIAGQNLADWTLSGPEAIVDTSLGAASWTIPADVVRLRTVASGDQKVAVLIVQDLNIPSTATLSVRGDRPLVILVKGIATIDGIVSYDGVKRGPSTPANVCPGQGVFGHASLGTSEGSGGGGGSLGTSGADGGAAGGLDGGMAGAVSMNPTAVPLLMGCDGGAGGFTATAGVGGRGGGALQISAATQIVITGTVGAGGAGGPGGVSRSAGGGGGGGGGTILIESPDVMLAPGAWNPDGPKLCANGGGGGAGADPGNSVAGPRGTDAVCLDLAAAGGMGVNSQPPGGNGASRSTIATGGASTATISGGGGGGGGGLGTIRINGTIGGTASLSTPLYTTDP